MRVYFFVKVQLKNWCEGTTKSTSGCSVGNGNMDLWRWGLDGIF